MPADLGKHSSGRCSPQPSKLVMWTEIALVQRVTYLTDKGTRQDTTWSRTLPVSERVQIMLLIMVGGWIACTAFFLMSHFGPRRAPSAIRPAIGWIWTGTMPIYASVTLSIVAHQYGWTRIHRTIDVVGLALNAAGLICLGVGVFKVWRRSRTDRQKVNASA